MVKNNIIELSDKKRISEKLGRSTTYKELEMFLDNNNAFIEDTIESGSPSQITLIINQDNEMYTAQATLPKGCSSITDKTKIKISTLKSLAST